MSADAAKPDIASVWLDACWAGPGLFAPPIAFDPSDRGLLLADGVFDTALVLGHRCVWRERHVARLVAACDALGFALAPSRIERAIDAVLPLVEHGSLRLTATRGPGPRGLLPPADPRPTLLAAAAPLRAGSIFAPTALWTSTVRRNDTSPLSRIKGLGYADAVHAAALAGGAEPLFLNTRGVVACAGTANVVAVIGDRLVTPPLADGVLDGIGRRVALAVAPAIGLKAEERSLAPSDLSGAAAVLLTSSLRLASPVEALDRRPLPGAAIARRLVDAIAAAVRADCGTDPRDLR